MGSDEDLAVASEHDIKSTSRCCPSEWPASARRRACRARQVIRLSGRVDSA